MQSKFLRKISNALICGFIFIFGSGFTSEEFSIDHFNAYEKEFETEEMDVCFNVSAKTYMPYQAVTNVNSKQYKHIHEKMTIDETTGFLYDEDGFIGAALASNFGEIGSRFYFTLDTGIVLPIVKVDAKSDSATNGCAAHNGHIIEFVIDAKIAGEYFGVGPSGLASYGNFNNDERFEGVIVKIEKVLDTKVEKDVTYMYKSDFETYSENEINDDLDLFGGY